MYLEKKSEYFNLTRILGEYFLPNFTVNSEKFASQQFWANLFQEIFGNVRIGYFAQKAKTTTLRDS